MTDKKEIIGTNGQPLGQIGDPELFGYAATVEITWGAPASGRIVVKQKGEDVDTCLSSAESVLKRFIADLPGFKVVVTL